MTGSGVRAEDVVGPARTVLERELAAIEVLVADLVAGRRPVC